MTHEAIKQIEATAICENCHGDPEGYAPSIVHTGTDHETDGRVSFHCEICGTRYDPRSEGGVYAATVDDLTFPEPTAEQLAEVEAMEAKSAKAAREREESWQRSDTDGFLSQWSSGLTSRMHSIAADLLRDGGVAAFYALFKDGRRVKARLVDGEWGPVWCVLDSDNRAREWIPHKPTCKRFGEPCDFSSRAKGHKLGYSLGYELAPARAAIHGTGTGLSGQAWATHERTDRGYPDTAVPYEAL